MIEIGDVVLHHIYGARCLVIDVFADGVHVWCPQNDSIYRLPIDALNHYWCMGSSATEAEKAALVEMTMRVSNV